MIYMSLNFTATVHTTDSNDEVLTSVYSGVRVDSAKDVVTWGLDAVKGSHHVGVSYEGFTLGDIVKIDEPGRPVMVGVLTNVYESNPYDDEQVMVVANVENPGNGSFSLCTPLDLIQKVEVN